MTSAPHDTAPARAAREALAGYVTGGLSEDERRIVEAHIEDCDDCRFEIAELQSLHAGVAQALRAEPSPGIRVRDEVFARLGIDERDDRKVGLLERFSDWLQVRSVPRWAQAIAIVFIVGEGILLVAPQPTPKTDVTTRALPARPTVLAVTFAPQATADAIRTWLGALDAHIVGGPGANGEFTVELAPADPKVIAERLRTARAASDVVQTIAAAP